MRLFNWTHSWTVHSGIVSGIRPLFSRLQSKSSPEHAQGGGHVLVLAPDPRCRLRNSRKNTANLAKLRGCVQDHIFSGHTREHPTFKLCVFSWSATNPKVREITHRKKKSQIWCWSPTQSILISNPLSLWGPWMCDLKGKRSSETCPFLWGNFFCRAPRCCCWGNLCCAGSPQRSLSTHQRYAGGGTTGVHGTCSLLLPPQVLRVCTSSDAFIIKN